MQECRQVWRASSQPTRKWRALMTIWLMRMIHAGVARRLVAAAHHVLGNRYGRLRTIRFWKMIMAPPDHPNVPTDNLACTSFDDPPSWHLASLPIIAIVALPLLQSCSSPERLPPVPIEETGRALPLGLPNARFFPLLERDKFIAEWEQALQRQRQTLGLPSDAQLPEAEFLAISGGGDNGAFGSGILVGWTEAGDRPEFEVVTGVSTGALIAPFAFLGPEYDTQLRDVYTTISASDVFSERGLLGGFFEDAM